MNNVKIAAALHALADAFLEGAEPAAEPAKKGGKKTASAVDPTPAVAPTASAVGAPATVAAAPAPAVPSVSLADVNKMVLKVAAKNRDGAVAILSRFKLTNTVGLPQELWQPVFDAFEEEIAKMDAAAVQVAQASLV